MKTWGNEQIDYRNSKIDTFQNYFGIALDQNIGNLEKMINSVIASHFHVSGYHVDCPRDKDALYKNQQHKNANFSSKRK